MIGNIFYVYTHFSREGFVDFLRDKQQKIFDIVSSIFRSFANCCLFTCCWKAKKVKKIDSKDQLSPAILNPPILNKNSDKPQQDKNVHEETPLKQEPKDAPVITQEAEAFLKEGENCTGMQAFNLYLKAAELNHPEAQFKVSICYKEGLGIDADEINSLKWLVKAAEGGCEKAQFLLGVHYNEGNGVEVNQKLAFHWFEQAAKRNVPEAQYNIAVRYNEGNGVEVNQKLAFHWFERAAHSGLTVAQYHLGKLYHQGLGVEKNLVKSFHFYNLAVEGFDSYLLRCSLEKKPVDVQQKRLVESIEQAANAGVISAQEMMASYYEEGIIVDKDVKKAEEWRKKLAEGITDQAKIEIYTKEVNTCFRFAKVECRYGNLEEGTSQLKRAAEKGHLRAQYLLSCIYTKSYESPLYNEGLVWRKSAAEGGDVEAQCVYGFRLFFSGNKEEANKWLRLAADGGDLTALQHFKEMENSK